jgi:murein DD-endopeptidase MepM/ murein hydrolase activator NlpD
MIPLLLTAGRMLATGAVRGAAAGATRGAITQSVKKVAVDAAKKKAGGLAKSFIKKKIANAKKVSTRKLLPGSKKGGGGAGLVRKKSSAIVKSPTSALQKNVDKEKDGEKQNQEESKPFNGDELIQELTAIKETLTKIKGVFGSNLANTLRNQKNQRILRSKQKASEKESDLEKKPEKKQDGGGLKIPKKKMSFLDMIWNFISNVFLGSLLNWLWNHIPQILKMFEDISKGLTNTWQVLRLGIITISVVCRKQIKFLAKLTAKIIGPSSRLIGRLLLAAGGLVERLFPRVGKIINDLIRGPLNALIRASVGGSRGSAAGAQALQRSKPGTGGRPKVTGSGGGRAGGIDVRNPVRQRPKVTTSGGGRAGGIDVRNPLRQGPAVTTGMGGKAGPSKLVNRLKIFSKIFKRIPVIGALIGIGIDMALGESLGRAAAGAAGAAIGSGVGLALGKGGALAVTLATGGIGILAAPIIIGASALLGSAVGDWAGKQIYDKVTSGAKVADKAAPVERRASGGGIGGWFRGAFGSGHQAKAIPAKPAISSSRIPASVETNAKKNIVKDEKSLERFKTLSSVFSGTPFVGPLLKLGIDIGMGAKVQKTDTDIAAQTLGYTIGKALDDDEFSVPGLRKKVIGPLSKNLTEWAKKRIFYELKSSEGLFPPIEKSEDEKAKTSPGQPGSTGDGGDVEPGAGPTVTGGTADFWAMVAVASLENSNPQGQADVAQVLYNRLASGEYTGKSIKALVLAKGQFQPTREGDPKVWAAITDKQSAIAAVATHPRGRTNAARMVEASAASIQNPVLQKSAAQFVGGRTDFSATGQYAPYPGAIGIVKRHGHDIGWFVGPGSIAYGKTNPGPAKAPRLGNIAVTAPSPSGGGGGGGQEPPSNANLANLPKQSKQIVFHWTAGNYNDTPSRYHTVFTGDGKKHSMHPYTKKVGGTLYRPDAINLSISANPDKGMWPKEAQLNAMAKETAMLAKSWGWSKSSINVRNVSGHGEAGAGKDGKLSQNISTGREPSKGPAGSIDNYGPVVWGGDGSRSDLSRLKPGDRIGQGENAFRERVKANMGGGHGFNHHALPSFAMGGGGHTITSSMGMRNFALSPGMHMGVDIAGRTGEPLQAFTDGKVEATGNDGGYGNYVSWIDSKGIGHFYGHMNKPAFVKAGQNVKKGTILGELGSTGRSSGPHLHWEAATNPKDTGMSKSNVLSRFNPLSKYNKEAPFGGTIKADGFFPSSGEVASSQPGSAAPGAPSTNTESSIPDSAYTSHIIRGDPGIGGMGGPNNNESARKPSGSSTAPSSGTTDPKDGTKTGGNAAIITAAKAAVSQGKQGPAKPPCASWVRMVLGMAKHPAAKKVTSYSDLDSEKKTWGENMAASFAGSDMGAVVRSQSALQPGDIVLHKNTYGNYPTGAITHVSIASDKPGKILHQSTSGGPPKEGGIFKFAAGVRLGGGGVIGSFDGGDAASGGGGAAAGPSPSQSSIPDSAYTSHIIKGDPGIDSTIESIKQKPSYDQGGQQNIVMMPISQGSSGQQANQGGVTPRSTPQISTGLNSKEVAALSVNQFYAAALYKM